MDYAIDFVRKNGIHQTQVRCTTTGDHTTDFYGSLYGGPVFIDVGFGQLRVEDPERFGVFAESPSAWVAEFYASCASEEETT